ncbi:MAG: class I SAM-dependent methyltransferase [Bacteroidales bacterium]|nr:class I SAM-dependent methyltransferase [Bacteroidales bacterium]
MFNSYLTVIDPLLRNAHKAAAELIPVNSNVIDIACGNGTLAFLCSLRAGNVTGIDISGQMIEFARKRAKKNNTGNVQFIEMNALDLSRFDDHQYDIAYISMAIHQFEYAAALSILEQAKRIAKKMILMDYQHPLPGGFKGLVTRAIEWIAGEEHNSNFKSYLSLGGLKAYCKTLNIGVTEKEINKSVFVILKVH